MTKGYKLAITGLIIFALAFFAGLIYFVSWDNQRDKKEFTKNCENVAKIAGLKEWHSDGYDCYVLKDGKITEVKL